MNAIVIRFPYTARLVETKKLDVKPSLRDYAVTTRRAWLAKLQLRKKS